MKTLLTLTFLCFIFLTNAQKTDPALNVINTVQQGHAWCEEHSNAEMVSLMGVKDKETDLAPLLLLKTGETAVIGKSSFKLLESVPIKCYKVSYIMINGAQHKAKEIANLQKDIIAKYQAGTPFSELHANYSEDGNTTGELDWFNGEWMVAGFIKSIEKHKKDEIFTCDLKEQGWYYVVLKTHNEVDSKQLTLIKITQN